MTTRILGVDVGCVYTGLAFLEMSDRTLLPVANPEESFRVLVTETFNEMVAAVSINVRDFCQQANGQLVVALESAIPPRRALREWENTAQIRGTVKTAVALFGPAQLFEMTATEVRLAMGLRPLTQNDRLLKSLNRQAFLKSADMRVREQFCLLTGLDDKIFKGKLGSHKVDAGAIAYVTALRHLGAQNERLVA